MKQSQSSSCHHTSNTMRVAKSQIIRADNGLCYMWRPKPVKQIIVSQNTSKHSQRNFRPNKGKTLFKWLPKQIQPVCYNPWKNLFFDDKVTLPRGDSQPPIAVPPLRLPLRLPPRTTIQRCQETSRRTPLGLELHREKVYEKRINDCYRSQGPGSTSCKFSWFIFVELCKFFGIFLVFMWIFVQIYDFLGILLGIFDI